MSIFGTFLRKNDFLLIFYCGNGIQLFSLIGHSLTTYIFVCLDGGGDPYLYTKLL